ncbi:type VI secretion system ImpA domain-containing protein [Myxococcus xanthus]|uniref:Type VI secretion system ImpA domain-containing protein n=1 Tax=Myxococcus xanthus TaxID=34 RepID=A0AAE6KU26_MYXXA|nr:type VI secretion system protein TssA [Myxococcus xanthus]QDE69760.1 type VI secretion system ImpA domain-containing protein [Myxococcus xanthus]QDE77039.1 type VI secretion system ImpA domain-containing protein [Myxococcus xanthus]
MPPTLEQLRERALPWAEPVPGATPAGVQAKHEPAYEAVALEVAKLESPASNAVRWDDVVEGASELLKHTTKDLWLASYMAYGLYATRGLDGAATGTAVLAEVTERYWQDLFPEAKRLRGRANAVAWFVDRLGRILPTVDQASVSAEPLDALAVAVKRLAQLSRERFSDMAPAFGPLQDAIARLRAGLPEPEPVSVPDGRTASSGDADASQPPVDGNASSQEEDSASGEAGETGVRAADSAHATRHGAPPDSADTSPHGNDNRSARDAANGKPSQGNASATANGKPAQANGAGNSAAVGKGNTTQGNPTAKSAPAAKGNTAQDTAPGKGSAANPSSASANGTQAPPRAAAIEVPPLPELPSAPDLSSVDAVTDFLRTVGGALLGAAGALRRASPEDPLSYRLNRMGLWLHLTQPPAADGNGRTQIHPLPDLLRTKLETLEQNQRWGDLLDESESALARHRFTLTLHRYSAIALEGLGAAYAGARTALVQELAIQLRRMAGVETLISTLGTPLTDDATQDWLRDHVLRASAPPPAPSAAAVSVSTALALALRPLALGPPVHADSAALEAEARTLLEEGRVHEAVTRLQAAVTAASTGRARFISRLELARLCANAGQLPLARAVYDALDEEVTAHALDTWEPALAAACLEGWLQTRTDAEKESGPVAVKFRNRYRRLALLDSSATLRVGA